MQPLPNYFALFFSLDNCMLYFIVCFICICHMSMKVLNYCRDMRIGVISEDLRTLTVSMCLSVRMSHDWKLVTFDFDLWPRELFLYFFSARAIPFERLYLATSFSVWRYVFRIFRSEFTFKVMGPRSRQQKAVAWNTKTTAQKLLGLDRNIL